MAFSNSVVGGVVLVRPAIQSPNFENDPENGVTGWQIAADGSATFYNVTIGSQSYFVDSDGNATFKTITANEGLIVNGMSLAELLDQLPRGIVAVTTLSGQSARYNGTEIIFARMTVPAFSIGRQYVIGASNLLVDHNNTSLTTATIRVRYAWGSQPTISSPSLFAHQEVFYSSNTVAQSATFRHPWTNNDPLNDGQDLHLAFTLTANAADGTNGMQAVAGNGTRLYVEDVGPAVDYQSYTMDPGTPPPAPPAQYVKTYSATWSESYQGDGTSRGSFDNGDCFQGYYSGTNGNQFSLIGFNYAQIASDLSGATIKKTELYLDNSHWYNNSGGTAVIGYHNYTSAPSTATYPSGTDNITRASFTYGQAKWVTVSNAIGTAFRTGAARGILLGKGQTAGGTLSNDRAYYGYFVGAGKTGAPRLRITYEK